MRIATVLAAASILALAACADTEPVTNYVDVAANEVSLDNMAMTANDTASLTPAISFTNGDGAALGSASLEDGAAGLVISLAGTGMPPGSHGIHIHMVGKCDGPKFESAGAHWNPENKQHGTGNPAGAHKGDLPNVTVAADGSLSETLTVTGASMAELRDSDGSALVVHAQPDDNKTDPSGNSGDRIACAVIAPAS